LAVRISSLSEGLRASVALGLRRDLDHAALGHFGVGHLDDALVALEKIN